MNFHEPKALVAGRFFLLLQVLFFLAVLLGLILYRKKIKEREKGAEVNPENLGKGYQVRRTTIPNPETEKKQTTFLTTTFPTWNEHTPPHDVLGVPVGSDEMTIERSFRDRMKKYHPDRFASDGVEYQKRAHEIVLLIQTAREKLVRKK